MKGTVQTVPFWLIKTHVNVCCGLHFSVGWVLIILILRFQLVSFLQTLTKPCKMWYPKKIQTTSPHSAQETKGMI